MFAETLVFSKMTSVFLWKILNLMGTFALLVFIANDVLKFLLFSSLLKKNHNRTQYIWPSDQNLHNHFRDTSKDHKAHNNYGLHFQEPETFWCNHFSAKEFLNKCLSSPLNSILQNASVIPKPQVKPPRLLF